MYKYIYIYIQIIYSMFCSFAINLLSRIYKFLFFPAPVTSVQSPRLLIAVDLSSSKLFSHWHRSTSYTPMTSPVDYWLSQDASKRLGSQKMQENFGVGPFTAPPTAWSLGRYNCSEKKGSSFYQKLLQRKSTIPLLTTNHS